MWPAQVTEPSSVGTGGLLCPQQPALWLHCRRTMAGWLVRVPRYNPTGKSRCDTESHSPSPTPWDRVKEARSLECARQCDVALCPADAPGSFLASAAACLQNSSSSPSPNRSPQPSHLRAQATRVGVTRISLPCPARPVHILCLPPPPTSPHCFLSGNNLHTHSTHLSPKQRQTDSSQSQTNGSPSHTTFNGSTLLIGYRPQASAPPGLAPAHLPTPRTSPLAHAHTHAPFCHGATTHAAPSAWNRPLRILVRSYLPFKFHATIYLQDTVQRGKSKVDNGKKMIRK